MKKIVISILLVFFCAIASAQINIQLSKVKMGEKAPEFQVEMTDGRTVKLSDLKGKVVCVYFYTTWCGPCRTGLSWAQKEIVERFAGKDFVYLPISRGEEKEKIKAFFEKQGYKCASGLDVEGNIMAQYSDHGIPQYFLVGFDGELLCSQVGNYVVGVDGKTRLIDGYAGDEVVKLIETTLKKQPKHKSKQF